MKPLSDFTMAERAAIRGVFADIDDTITTDGRLTADAYGAMEQLQASGLLVVPITGRSAGWCDHIARMWPVDGVVGENGSFYFRYDRENRRMNRYHVYGDDERADNRKRLATLGKRIVELVPGAAVAAGQHYCENDLAIDFCEDVDPLPSSEVDRIVSLFEEAGATAKVSSIHVNGWFGTYDKLATTKRFVADCLDVVLDNAKNDFVFVGDSPNDVPMFEFFPNSVGVANVRDFEDRLTAEPTYVTEGKAGTGFSELAAALIAARGGRL